MVFQKTEGKSTDSIASFSLKRPEYILFYSPISISIFIFSLYSKMVNPILLFLFSVLFIIYYPYQIDGAVQCYACFKNKTKQTGGPCNEPTSNNTIVNDCVYCGKKHKGGKHRRFFGKSFE